MTLMSNALSRGRIITEHRPWSRIVVDADAWSEAGSQLGDGVLTLLALWGEPEAVHMAVADAADPASALVLSIECPDRCYPSVGRLHAPAIRLERAVQDLFGITANGLPDSRAWLDHGQWGVRAPLAQEPMPDRPAEDYAFLPVEAENIHQVPVGPVHAGVIEPGHFRFSADGETVVRLEQRFGYTHKGVESLFRGASLSRAA